MENENVMVVETIDADLARTLEMLCQEAQSQGMAMTVHHDILHPMYENDKAFYWYVRVYRVKENYLGYGYQMGLEGFHNALKACLKRLRARK